MDDPYTTPLPYVEYPPHDPGRWQSTDGFNDLPPEALTNGKRAAQAEEIIGYAHLVDRMKDHSDYSDLITNLLHLANREGHDPFDIYTYALNNFYAEAAPLH